MMIIINDLKDIDIDRNVERTKNRPLATGKITVREAYFFLFVHLLLFFYLLTFFNFICIFFTLLMIPLLILYPFMKQITFFPGIIPGIMYGNEIFVGFSLIQGKIAFKLTFPLFLLSMFYELLADTLYGYSDIEDDLKIQVKSTAIFFKDKVKSFLFVILFIKQILLMIIFYNFEINNIISIFLMILGQFILFVIIIKIDLKSKESILYYFRNTSLYGFIILLSFLFFRIIQ